MVPAFRPPCGQLVEKLVDVGGDEFDLGHRTLKRHGRIHGRVPPVAVILEVDLLLCDVGVLVVFVADVIPGFGNADRRKGVYMVVFVGRRAVVHIVHPRYDVIPGGMHRQRGADRMMSVRRLLATEHLLLYGFAADLVAEHLDDPAHVVRVGFRRFGTPRRLVGFYFRVDR